MMFYRMTRTGWRRIRSLTSHRLTGPSTSGMKAMFNGALNLSVLDGWWAEAWNGSNGWAIPADPMQDEAARDVRDSKLFFEMIEKEVIPLFYDRDKAGIPHAWLSRVKASLRTNGPRFCAARVLDEYRRLIYTKS